jgi:hypothetical protein
MFGLKVYELVAIIMGVVVCALGLGCFLWEKLSTWRWRNYKRLHPIEDYLKPYQEVHSEYKLENISPCSKCLNSFTRTTLDPWRVEYKCRVFKDVEIHKDSKGNLLCSHFEVELERVNA